jgi:hypothetical protein
VQVILELGEPMSAFVRGGDGTLYVGTRSGSLWVRPARSTLFVKRTGGPHLRCLGERQGTVYGCADSQADGYALGVSLDQGATFQPVLRYSDVTSTLACPSVQADCTSALAALRRQFPAPSDGGAADAGTPEAADAGATPPPPKKSGCGCEAGAGPEGLLALALALSASAARERRSPRRGSRRRSGSRR